MKGIISKVREWVGSDKNNKTKEPMVPFNKNNKGEIQIWGTVTGFIVGIGLILLFVFNCCDVCTCGGCSTCLGCATNCMKCSASCCGVDVN